MTSKPETKLKAAEEKVSTCTEAMRAAYREYKRLEGELDKANEELRSLVRALKEEAK